MVKSVTVPPAPIVAVAVAVFIPEDGVENVTVGAVLYPVPGLVKVSDVITPLVVDAVATAPTFG